MRRFIASVLFVTIVIASLCFSAYADFIEAPIIRLQFTGGYWQTLTDCIYENPTDVTLGSETQTILGPSNYNSTLSRIQIVDTNNLNSQYLLYQFVLVPLLPKTDTTTTIGRLSGKINISRIDGADSATVYCRPISLANNPLYFPAGSSTPTRYEYDARVNNALLVSINVIVSDGGSSDNITLYLALNKLFDFQGVQSNEDIGVFCYKVSCYTSYASNFYQINNGIGGLHNDLVQLTGIFRPLSFLNWNYQLVDRTDPDYPVVSNQTGTWFQAILGTLSAISDPVIQQVEQEQKAQEAGAMDALDVAYDSVGSSFGLLGDFAGLGELGAFDGDTFGAEGEHSILDWFSTATKNSIDNVAPSRRNQEPIVDFYHSKIEEYEDKIEGSDKR